MSSYDNHRYNNPHSYAPSAPSLPEPHPYNHNTSSTTNVSSSSYNSNSNSYDQHGSGSGSGGYHQSSSLYSNYAHGGAYNHDSQAYNAHSSGYGQVSSSGYASGPPGTIPDDIRRSFEAVDRDRSGFIDERELQQALASAFHKFDLKTVRFLMFLFKNPHDPLRIGPKEFSSLWSCLGHWRGIFERYDRDRSGKIDPLELRDALYGIGYAVPGSVLQLLLSKYSRGSGANVELGFDNFVECGMIIKGLTDKFKEKDKRYTGSATLLYDDFMAMVIPFLISYD